VSDIVKHINKETKELAKMLPEIPDMDVLQKCCDASVYKGLKKVDEIIDNNKKDETKIKAFNAIIALARYLELRKVTESKSENKIIMDVGSLMG